MEKIILALIVIMLSSCHQSVKDKRPDGSNLVCNEFYIKGQYKNAKYTFCGSIPIEESYSYKSGEWKFWNLNGQLIAEWRFHPQKIKVEDHGGCPYEIMKGIILEENWNF